MVTGCHGDGAMKSAADETVLLASGRVCHMSVGDARCHAGAGGRRREIQVRET